MKLKPRFLLLTGLLVLVAATATWFATRKLAEDLIEQWAIRYAEKQVLYDKARLLQPILREVALSRQMVNSPDIVAWARSPDNPQFARRAMVELEQYRLNFADKSYFFALRESGHYYHNNARNEFAGRQYRYTLDAAKPADRWFYDIIRQQRDLHINVNPDVNLGVTKLWIDMLVRDGNRILGVAGTGLDLTSFIHAVVDQTQPGMTSLFVDHGGAIQAHRDQTLIDYASISKNARDKKTLDLVFQRQEDRDAIYAAMKELEKAESQMISRPVQIDGRRHLAGVAYLPEIDWYEITLLDLDELVPMSYFRGILLVYAATLLLALILFNMALNRLILRPLARLDRAVGSMEKGLYATDALPPPKGDNEIDRLIEHFRRMATAIGEARSSLESKVRERTEALDHLAKTDPLTGLLNRRGMGERFSAEISRARREKGHVGLLWLDVDEFKEINDQHGHDKGDAALQAVAAMLSALVRPYDTVARWGGDEFLVLTQAHDIADLRGLGERIHAAMHDTRLLLDADSHPIRVTLSIGGYCADAGDDMETILHRADQALYLAKNDGRDCFRIFHLDCP